MFGFRFIWMSWYLELLAPLCLLLIPSDSLVAQTVKHLFTKQETQVRTLGWEDPREKEMATHTSTLAYNSMGGGACWTTVHGVAKSQTRLSDFAFSFPGGSDGKASACNAGDPGSIPGSGRSAGEGNGNSLQYSCLENSMDWGARNTVQEVAKIWTQLRDFTLFINFWFYYIVLRESSLKDFNLEKMYFLSPRTCSISVSVPRIHTESIILCARV